MLLQNQHISIYNKFLGSLLRDTILFQCLTPQEIH